MFKLYNSQGQAIIDDLTLIYHVIHEQSVPKKGTTIRLELPMLNYPILAVTNGAAEMIRGDIGIVVVKTHLDNTNFMVMVCEPLPKPGFGVRINNANRGAIIDSSYRFLRRHTVVNAYARSEGKFGLNQDIVSTDGAYTYRRSTGYIHANNIDVPHGHALVDYGCTSNYWKLVNSNTYLTMCTVGIVNKSVVFVPKIEPRRDQYMPFSDEHWFINNGAFAIAEV